MRPSAQEAFFTRLHKYGRGVLMTDYDGTLAPFRVDRRAAFPYAGVVPRLCRLAADRRIRLILISGRAIRDLKRLLASVHPLPELWGSHGLERLLPNGIYWKATIDDATKRALRKARELCCTLADRCRCERKPFGIAFHTRGMRASAARRIQETVHNAWTGICQKSHLAIYPFDGGLELRLQDGDKGHAVKTIVQETGPRAAVAYLGDDITDEAAFAAVGTKGLKILVRSTPRCSQADICLRPPREILAFFDRCQEVV